MSKRRDHEWLDVPIVLSKLIKSYMNFNSKQYKYSSHDSSKTEALRKVRKIRKSGAFARIVWHSGRKEWIVYRRRADRKHVK